MPRYCVAVIAGQLVVGGAEKQLYLWLSNLDRKLFEPIVVTLNPGVGDYWEGPIRSLGIPLLEDSHRRSWPARLQHIVRDLQPFKPHLIHGWHLFASPYAGLAGKLLGAKSVGSHRGSPEAFRNGRAEAMLTRHLVDRLLVNSHSAARVLGEKHPRVARLIRVVQNAIEAEACDKQEARRALSLAFSVKEESLWLGSMGRLVPQKGFDILLDIVHALRSSVKDLHLFLIGEGPDRERLQGKVTERGLLNLVTFAGEDPNARKWLSAIDIFCFTSLDEGLPNAVMEAAAAGLPVVAWRTPSLQELLQNEVSALLIDPGDVPSFENALLILARSRELRDKLGHAARNHIVSRFSIDQFVRKMTSVYLDVLGAAHREGGVLQ